MNQYVTIKFFAGLKAFEPENADSFPIRSNETVKSLLNTLNIPETEAKLIFINNKRAELDSAVQPGDRVGIFPPVGGG